MPAGPKPCASARRTIAQFRQAFSASVRSWPPTRATRRHVALDRPVVGACRLGSCLDRQVADIVSAARPDSPSGRGLLMGAGSARADGSLRLAPRCGAASVLALRTAQGRPWLVDSARPGPRPFGVHFRWLQLVPYELYLVDFHVSEVSVGQNPAALRRTRPASAA